MLWCLCWLGLWMDFDCFAWWSDSWMERSLIALTAYEFQILDAKLSHPVSVASVPSFSIADTAIVWGEDCWALCCLLQMVVALQMELSQRSCKNLLWRLWHVTDEKRQFFDHWPTLVVVSKLRTVCLFCGFPGLSGRDGDCSWYLSWSVDKAIPQRILTACSALSLWSWTMMNLENYLRWDHVRSSCMAWSQSQ